jgi:hypothetical protein
VNRYGPGEILGKDKKPTGKWVFVAWNPNFTWRVGYCAEGCKGHTHKIDAIAHFRDWLLETLTNYDGRIEWSVPCEVCENDTAMFAYVREFGWEYHLCEQHLDREDVAKLMGDFKGLVR